MHARKKRITMQKEMKKKVRHESVSMYAAGIPRIRTSFMTNENEILDRFLRLRFPS